MYYSDKTFFKINNLLGHLKKDKKARYPSYCLSFPG